MRSAPYITAAVPPQTRRWSRGQRLIGFTFVVLSTMTASARPAFTQEIHLTSGKAALEVFRQQAQNGTANLLVRLRPAPLDEASRARVLASLPATGELHPSSSELVKIEAADRILNYSARRGVITFKVVDLDHAFAGLYFRTVVLVSRQQLAILDAEEFMAVVAHELGHDYHWDAYFVAIQAHDDARRRELELRADGLAALALRGVSVSPERLVTALQKTMRYNEHRGTAVNEGAYAPLLERVAFIRAIAALPWQEVSQQAVGGHGVLRRPE
jgi:Zn-dependent protease with chaperone function